ncbi:DMT family transporter [Effusibacillus consociatus]|uniref:DMT family transporter n=1 Tax=Effusibacillus consociatus TaxID=1117041 RepID=A0ABV9PZR7_9BACL
MKWVMMVLAVLGGMAVGTQAGINGILGKKIGTLEGALVSFAIGTLSLSIVAIFLGKGNILGAFSVPKWQLTGGLLGAFYVFVMVLVVPQLGAASTIIAIIAGQLLATSIIDHFGLIGAKQIPMDWQRAAGLVLMAAAIILFNKR